MAVPMHVCIGVKKFKTFQRLAQNGGYDVFGQDARVLLGALIDLQLLLLALHVVYDVKHRTLMQLGLRTATSGGDWERTAVHELHHNPKFLRRCHEGSVEIQQVLVAANILKPRQIFLQVSQI